MTPEKEPVIGPAMELVMESGIRLEMKPQTLIPCSLFGSAKAPERKPAIVLVMIPEIGLAMEPVMGSAMEPVN